ncbi:MAG: hypothetical protein QFX33_04810 [Candidatus Nezhaarchaeota archaeon]|nr:hypothetical protein [Candidatus Nezhaarchaeota archaeon]
MSMQYQVKVLRSVDNKVLNRKELVLHVDHSGSKTPTRDEVRGLVSSMLGVPLNLVVVKSLKTLSGTNVTEGHIHVYGDEKALEDVEAKHIKLRNFGKKDEESKGEEKK